MADITPQEIERAIIVGLNLNNNINFLHSMEELKALTKACNIDVIGMHTQNASGVNNAFYVGTGKVDEIKESILSLNADMVIFDKTLSPMQFRNLTEAFNIPVFDRTSLILKIFAERAKTKEAKLQVELANLQYMLPRLVGMHTALSRQGGASGSMSNKGTGEKKLELDRRYIESRISELKKSLGQIAQTRNITRSKREQSGIIKIALVGYTNAGKSTIMNWMVSLFGNENENLVLEKDMLFATLDTTIRKISTDVLPAFLLSDTVGFIDKLPHSLIKAFQSTLEEVTYADLILHVVDYSDEYYDKQIETTENTLKELGANKIPYIQIFNKSEYKLEKNKLPIVAGNKIYLSARERIGMDHLLKMIYDILYAGKHKCEFMFPLSRGDILNVLFNKAVVSDYEYLENGILCHCTCDSEEFYKYEQYIVNKE